MSSAMPLIAYAETCAAYAARAEACLADARRALDDGDADRAAQWLDNARHWLSVIREPVRVAS